MDILDKVSDDDLLKSIVAEAAKASNELSCAERDIRKLKAD